jgi:hypothetical protein
MLSAQAESSQETFRINTLNSLIRHNNLRFLVKDEPIPAPYFILLGEFVRQFNTDHTFGQNCSSQISGHRLENTFAVLNGAG